MPGRTRHTGALVLAAALALAGPPAGAGGEDFGPSLVRLGDQALAAGDLRTARSRYERAASARPDLAGAHSGLGAVALRQGDEAAATAHFEAALALEPGERRARLELAGLAERRGDLPAAREHVRQALAAAPLDAALHQRLFDLTGLASGPVPEGAEAIRALAAAHPYDPRAQLALAERRVAEGETEAAEASLWTALLVADLAPAVAPRAAALLAELAGEEDPRFVPVHVWADETVRDRPGWAFELRIAWGRAARALAPVLDTTFVPVSILPFSSARARDDLGSIQAELVRQSERRLPGILAGFTRRAAPRTPTARSLGEARYLGRELLVRLDPGDVEGRTLAHEVLHLYGAVHVSEEVPSLMNPVGGAFRLDRYNAALVGVTRTRRFGTGPVEQEVLAHVDEEALADALVAALSVNVTLRNAGLREALAEARTSRVAAALEAREAMGQDRHLAEVSRFAAWVLARRERVAEAILLMENAGRLFGPRTAEGREALALADRWRQEQARAVGPAR